MCMTKRQQLVKAFLSIKSEEEMNDFLQGILTGGEYDEIATRLQIVKMLKQEISQHDIAAQLGIGVATVTRGSKEIKKGRFKNI